MYLKQDFKVYITIKVLGLQWEHMLDNFLFEKQKPLELRS